MLGVPKFERIVNTKCFQAIEFRRFRIPDREDEEERLPRTGADALDRLRGKQTRVPGFDSGKASKSWEGFCESLGSQSKGAKASGFDLAVVIAVYANALWLLVWGHFRIEKRSKDRINIRRPA